MEATYSKTEFKEYTHRFKVQFKTNEKYLLSLDIYSNSDSYQKLEEFINEKKSDRVVSFTIIHRATKEQDEMAAKLIEDAFN